MSGDVAAVAAAEVSPRDTAAHASGNVVSASAPSLRSPLDACNLLCAKPPLASDAATATTRAHDKRADDERAETVLTTASVSVPTATPSSPGVTSKRRAVSFQDRLPQRSPASSAKNAVATALASVSTATTERFAKFRSLSSDNFLKRSKMPPASTSATAAVGATPLLRRTGSWKVNVNGLARRAKEVAMRATSGSRAYSWETRADATQCVSRMFEYHGEDAGAAAPYYHIVADGVSSPFGRNSLALTKLEPVSSELIATELVRAVQQALKDITNDNQSCLDVKTFESVVVSAIQTTRIKLFQHRQSRIAATLVVAYFDRWHGRLLTFSLGDSKCIIVRSGAVVFETPAVLRDFNMPTVVNLSNPVAHTDYVVQSFALQALDLCLTFSDGIGDNLYIDDITRAVHDTTTEALPASSGSTDSADSSSGSSSSSGGGESSSSGGALSREALQRLCDALVCQSQMKISVERAQEELLLLAAHDGVGDDACSSPMAGSTDATDCESEHALAATVRMSVHATPVRGLFPFATAAALEYRARALEECSPSSDAVASQSQSHSQSNSCSAKAMDHLACSLALYEKHKTKCTLARQQLVPRPASRKRHYTLVQLKRMAEMQTKKPDDITLFITQFR